MYRYYSILSRPVAARGQEESADNSEVKISLRPLLSVIKLKVSVFVFIFATLHRHDELQFLNGGDMTSTLDDTPGLLQR